MENSVLLTHIVDLYSLHKKYAVKLKSKLSIGSLCKEDEVKFRNAFYVIQELESYYKGCSCLENTDLCDLIVTAKTLLK